jgi:CheY-like chemotaxis protein
MQLQADRRKGQEVEQDENVLAGRHFLVAEDVELNAEILNEILAMQEVTCKVVENGQQAVEEFVRARPGLYDAILMDVQMPVMNGYDATRQIRLLRRPDAALIPIIAMTANAFTEDVKEALDAGMNAHVAKPVDPQQLSGTLSGFFRKAERSI